MPRDKVKTYPLSHFAAILSRGRNSFPSRRPIRPRPAQTRTFKTTTRDNTEQDDAKQGSTSNLTRRTKKTAPEKRTTSRRADKTDAVEEQISDSQPEYEDFLAEGMLSHGRTETRHDHARPRLHIQQSEPDSLSAATTTTASDSSSVSYSQLPYSQIPPRVPDIDFGDPWQDTLCMTDVLDTLDSNPGVLCDFKANREQTLTWFSDNKTTPDDLPTMTERQWNDCPLDLREKAVLRSFAIGLQMARFSSSR